MSGGGVAHGRREMSNSMRKSKYFATMRPAFKPAGLWYGLEPQHDTLVIERARDTVVRGPALVS